MLVSPHAEANQRRTDDLGRDHGSTKYCKILDD